MPGATVDARCDAPEGWPVVEAVNAVRTAVARFERAPAQSRAVHVGLLVVAAGQLVAAASTLTSAEVLEMADRCWWAW